ncbi:MAG: bifunctional YncE family protein/alkaline phosphatase family protein [Pyrinomonadaceae bacterium]
MTDRERSKSHYTTALLGGLIVLLLIGGTGTLARRDREDEPASGGRRITPAGSLVVDVTTRQPAVGALPVDFVRSPDHAGRDGGGRYLIAVNSGFGLQFNAAGNRSQQSLSVIDLNAKPAPAVVQNIYFPSPQSVNVGLVFSPIAEADGSYALFAAGGFENKIWIFGFQPGSQTPITPTSAGPNTIVTAPFIDVSGFTPAAPSPRYNSDRAPVYPTGLAISPDGNTLFVANNLGDSLGIISDLRGARKLNRVDLRHASNPEAFIYPYTVVASPGVDDVGSLTSTTNPVGKGGPLKVYVSCWNDASVAVVHTGNFSRPVSYISVGRHPTAMLLNPKRTRLYVVNSNADSVSVIDTQTDKEIERINVRLSEDALPGNSPESLALKGSTLYVANAHSNSVAVIKLSLLAEGGPSSTSSMTKTEQETREKQMDRSIVRGFIPTGQYPSALAVAGEAIFVGNGKGSGVENSSVVVNKSGRYPNSPNDRFPAGSGRGVGQGGQYSISLVTGNISTFAIPDDPALAQYTQQVMRNNNLLGAKQTKLFPGASPIKHVIYVIKENRTYDQVFGDIARAGNGQPADGDPRLAIFGAGEAAQRPDGVAQAITPNHRALALRFGLFHRFFVNSEASPDGHNWSTAAFSSDYVDKAYRWGYGGRGRGYDYEGFNRLPDYNPMPGVPPLFGRSVAAADVANYMQRFIPYLNGSRDVAEPETLYLWDAAARAGLTYRNYGEFIGTLSEADVAAIRDNRSKSYPDISPTVSAFPTKKSLEGHHSNSCRNFDMDTPDAMTTDSYRAAKGSAGRPSALISSQANPGLRGASRLGAWLDEFRAFVAGREAGTDRFPNLSILRLPNDHTDGIRAGSPTPQFFVADNDYALGLLVEAVSNSPYWKDTAIFVVEDDAQDGPDHVDAHRSVALVISAYNRPGLLVHEFHNTVSMIRTIELLLGIAPMNQLDGTAVPMDIFGSKADLRPYEAQLPNIALDNLITPRARDAATAYWMRRTAEQNMSHADMADPATLNQIIWYSVRGNQPMPAISRLPAFDVMRFGLLEEREEVARAPATGARDD